MRYLDGDFQVLSPGAFVRCAVTGVEIPLDELKYWSVKRQEAYVDATASLGPLSRDRRDLRVSGPRISATRRTASPISSPIAAGLSNSRTIGNASARWRELGELAPSCRSAASCPFRW